MVAASISTFCAQKETPPEAPRDFSELCEKIMNLERGIEGIEEYGNYILLRSSTDDTTIDIMSKNTVPYQDQIGTHRVWCEGYAKKQAVNRLWDIISEHELDLAQCK